MLGEPWAWRGDAGQAGALLWACSSVPSWFPTLHLDQLGTQCSLWVLLSSVIICGLDMGFIFLPKSQTHYSCIFTLLVVT